MSAVDDVYPFTDLSAEPAPPPHPAATDAALDVDGGSRSLMERLRAELLDGDAIEKLPPPSPLIEGLLDLDTLAVMFGRPGSGKTHLALDMSLHVATDSWWHSHAVQAGHVLYVVAEGARGVGQRQQAWKALNRFYDSVDGLITWLPIPVSLLAPDQVHALAEVAAERRAVLVVIDTLGRAMAGGDENAFKDMSVVIDAAERIRRATGACVLLVHHSGKDASAGSRGHSSLLGAVHTELEVKNGGDGIITLTTTKQKDHGDNTLPWRFVLTPAADSVAIAAYRGDIPGDSDLSAKTIEALEVLRSIAVPGGVTAAKWVAAGDETNVSRATIYRAAKSLVECGLVSMTGTGGTARYMPVDQEES